MRFGQVPFPSQLFQVKRRPLDDQSTGARAEVAIEYP